VVFRGGFAGKTAGREFRDHGKSDGALEEHNLNFATIPYVLMLNKRDLPNAMSVPDLDEACRKKASRCWKRAIQGVGVFETLKEVAKLDLAELKKGG